MRQRLLSILIACQVFSAGFVQAVPFHFEFSNNQAMGFIGDESTFAADWCQYVENYFYTRYPDRRMIFYNAGVKNDTTFDVLERLDADILERKLDYCLVMLGTWDANFEDLNPARFQTYQDNMQTLLERLRRARCYPILMTPPMFDFQTRQRRMEDESYRFRLKTMSPNYNGVMGYYGSWVRDEAYAQDMRFVDTWGPLNGYTAEVRKTNELFSLMPDGVHPDPAGSVVIAAEVIDALAMEREQIGTIQVTFTGGANGWSSRGSSGGSVSELSGSTKHLSFIWKARSLPWVMPGEASIGVELADIDERFNQEHLHVIGLAAGDYQIYIAGKKVGDKFSDTELARGLDVHKLWDRPQFVRAQNVANMNARRYATTVLPLRELWQDVKRVRVNFPGDQARLDEVMNQSVGKMNALRLQSKELADKIYEASQPLGRNFEIRKIYTSSELKDIEAAKKAEEEAKKKAEAEAAEKKAEAEAQ